MNEYILCRFVADEKCYSNCLGFFPVINTPQQNCLTESPYCKYVVVSNPCRGEDEIPKRYNICTGPP